MSVIDGDLTVYHEDDYVMATLAGGPMDGTEVRINVARGLTMQEGRAVLPPDLFFEGHPPEAGYRAWTIIDGRARYRWYETADERVKAL